MVFPRLLLQNKRWKKEKADAILGTKAKNGQKRDLGERTEGINVQRIFAGGRKTYIPGG